MKKALLMFLSLVLALVSWSSVCADDGFYVVPSMRGNYAPVPKTGQMQPYVTGDDGDLHKGVAWPTPRFTDHNNGTVTDNLTGLIWMKNASNGEGADGFGPLTWTDAISAANNLHTGQHGLNDGSKTGDWRLPNVRELQSLVDFGHTGLALPTPNPFIGVTWEIPYWSSTIEAGGTDYAWFVSFDLGVVMSKARSFNYLVWCVRGDR